jgi:ribosomal protein L20
LLISGDHIWEKYRTANVLQDWAAPAIQYWRALEYEVKRRLYSPIKHFYPDLQGSDLTLGTITRAYDDRHSDGREKAIWQVMLSRVAPDNRPAFEKLIERLSKEKIQEKRKRLAHAETVDRKMAEEIHDLVLGSQSQQSGILPLLAELVDVR